MTSSRMRSKFSERSMGYQSASNTFQLLHAVSTPKLESIACSLTYRDHKNKWRTQFLNLNNNPLLAALPQATATRSVNSARSILSG